MTMLTTYQHQQSGTLRLYIRLDALKSLRVLAGPKFPDLRTVGVAVNGFFPCSAVVQGRIDFTARSITGHFLQPEDFVDKFDYPTS